MGPQTHNSATGNPTILPTREGLRPTPLVPWNPVRMTSFTLSSLTAPAVAENPGVLAAPTAALIDELGWGDRLGAVEIDPALSDTVNFVPAFNLRDDLAANCVLVSGARNGEERVAACVVLADSRADINGMVRKRLDVRKASFMSLDVAVERTGMEYGGITPIGLPSEWPIFIDSRVLSYPLLTLGAGVRAAKIIPRFPARGAAGRPGD
jgi:prolyl-tRNA editing enzyme YbaK/EbsC (Cys-tRNA(Pro) deacylase)